MKSISFFSLLVFLLMSCTNHGQLTLIEKLPKKLKENSGIVSYEKATAWFIADNGNKDNLYKVDFKGDIVKKLEVKNAKNTDWEDLAKDKKGNLYIGDFGNNDNTRKNLVVYKVGNPENENSNKIVAEKIQFNYPEQKKFPPRREEFFYDAEAFFHKDNFLYIFTKNRSNPFTGETFIYRIPDIKGNYEAKLIGKINIGSEWKTCQITSADISPNHKKIVLLSYGKLWVITDFSMDTFSKGNIREYDLGVRTQLEAICFIDDTTVLISDEKNHMSGRNLYSYTLD